jgi:hypothetical protein
MNFEEVINRPSTMKSEHHSGTDRTFGDRRPAKGRPQVRDKAAERKEALVLLAIAVLFLANVLLYVSHRYGFMLQNDARPRAALGAQVITD